MEEDDLPCIMGNNKILNSRYFFNQCFSNFLTLTYSEKYILYHNPLQIQTHTCRAQRNLLTVRISPYYLHSDMFHSILLESTALTALMDCDSGLEKHCTASLLSEGQKNGNIMIREVNDLSVLAMWKDLL